MTERIFCSPFWVTPVNKTEKQTKIKRVLAIALSVLCFTAAVLIIVFMPKPEDTLPELPPANFTVAKQSTETNTPFIMIIKYPMLSSDGDGRDFSEINQSLKNYEKDYFYSSDLPHQDGDVSSYMITTLDINLAAGDYLSYTADGMYTNNSYAEKLLHSVNVNAATGEIYTFSDVVKDNAKFEKAFANGKFTSQAPPSDDITKSSPEILLNFSPAYSIYPDIYFENGYFGIIAKAPNVYGYVKFTIPLKDAKKFLNEECPLVKFMTEGQN